MSRRVLTCACVSAALLLRGGESGLRLSVSCPVLDQLLRGGLPVGGVTELAGESGAGKTQLALQLCLSAQYPTEHGGLDSGQSAGARITCPASDGPVRSMRVVSSVTWRFWVYRSRVHLHRGHVSHQAAAAADLRSVLSAS